jgi:serine/threonine-protein kinase
MLEPNPESGPQKCLGNPVSTLGVGASSTSMACSLTGITLGEFHLLRRLGKGGMAEVWLAEQTSLQRHVAIKILLPEFVADATYLQRFRHEATAAGGLNHPNIVQVYMVGEQDGIHFIAQEYIQGRNLKEFITKKGPLEVSLALHILKQVASALQIATTSGIVHRDIKPENVLLTKTGVAKVADFGLAQLTLRGEKVALTEVGITLGTPLYMSPEQVNGKNLDGRSDIYSMGVMAWHMLAGRPPFTGETALEIAVKHLNELPVPLMHIRPDVHQSVADLIERMMSKRKEDRPADAQSVVLELKSLSRLVGMKETMPSKKGLRPPLETTGSVPTFLDRTFRQQMRWMIGSCALFMASTAGLGWALRTPDPFLKQVGTDVRTPRMKTTEEQLAHALASDGDEAAWILLRDRVDSTPHQKGLAEINLAMICLRDPRRRLEAEKQLNDFQNSSDVWLKANGKAGLAVLAGLNGDFATLREMGEQARNSVRQSDRDKHLDPQLDRALSDAIRRSQGR